MRFWNAGNVSAGVVQSVLQASIPGSGNDVALMVGRPCSILTHAFNLSWCEALNMKPRPTYFAMHHADISAEPGWLDKMLAELERIDCDVLSSVVPIKDMRGLTSTSVLDPEDATYRRITMADLPGLPASFRASEVPWAPEQGILGINTGLWVCKLDTWAETIRFHNTERIRQSEAGEFVPVVMPEDWNFGIDLHMRGLSVYATQVVKLRHYGIFGFPNDETFGSEAEDTWNVM